MLPDDVHARMIVASAVLEEMPADRGQRVHLVVEILVPDGEQLVVVAPVLQHAIEPLGGQVGPHIVIVVGQSIDIIRAARIAAHAHVGDGQVGQHQRQTLARVIALAGPESVEERLRPRVGIGQLGLVVEKALEGAPNVSADGRQVALVDHLGKATGGSGVEHIHRAHRGVGRIVAGDADLVKGSILPRDHQQPLAVRPGPMGQAVARINIQRATGARRRIVGVLVDGHHTGRYQALRRRQRHLLARL